MGLDQYAFARKGEEKTEIMYWRKHANLEGWMANLYHARGGEGNFNCVDLKLSEEDLLKLQLQHRDLPKSEGFFWGETTDYKVDDTQVFIDKALEMMKDGYEIIYTSSW